MPKKVDRQARRRLIADALMRIAADRGLEAVSLRHVAAEVGVTTGMVQHYFASKDEMMTFAVGVIGDDIGARMAEAAKDLGSSPSPRALVRAMLIQLLPLDEPRRREGRVALAFYAHAAVNPTVAAALHDDVARMIDFVAEQVRAARTASAAPKATDPAVAAAGLLALVEGLVVHVLGGHYPPDSAVAVFDAHVDALFGPPL
ncbi:MAG: TetR/AcrR family transcriptional regulator [Stackebrandtia sp.]